MVQPLALIIEDDEKLIDLFAVALQSAGFAIKMALDGQTALDELAVTVPALVILDLHLPKVSGVEVLARIRTDSRLADTRVLLVTADALMVKNLRQDVDLVLLKPISVKQLRELAQRVISSPNKRKD